MEWLLSQFVYFVLYSFLGWLCETIYCSIGSKKFINRGFLNGPFCPIYGTGALLVIDVFMKYKDDLVALFILSMVVTSVVEYITSYLLEKIFNLQLWDYSTYSFNLNGRVCLKNSLMFGVLSIAAVEVIHPAVESLQASLAAGESLADMAGKAADAAEEGFKATTTMLAVHGRAATRGEASRSLEDPGAKVASLIMQAFAKSL